MPDNFSVIVVVLVVDAGRTVTERFFFGLELLMHFQSRHKADARNLFGWLAFGKYIRRF